MPRPLERHLVAVETSHQLESTVAFAQFLFKDLRLITLIGERHDHSFGCGGPVLSIAEYCKNAAERNPRCKVMLEYNKGDDPTRIGSEAIRATYDRVRAGQIVPFDVRAFFLTPRGQNDLYSPAFGDYQPDQVRAAFIDPFYTKQQEDTGLFNLSGSHDRDVGEYLVHSYYPDMVRSFEEATRLARAGRSPHQVLKDAWKKVVDYYVLDAVLRDDDVDEYIVVAGEAHYMNIRGVLDGPFTKKLNEQSGRSGDCVKLFQTYLLPGR